MRADPLSIAILSGQANHAQSPTPALDTGLGAEKGDGEFEYAVRVPASRLSLALVLSNQVEQRGRAAHYLQKGVYL